MTSGHSHIEVIFHTLLEAEYTCAARVSSRLYQGGRVLSRKVLLGGKHLTMQ